MAETINLLERFERYLRNSGKSEKTIQTWYYILKNVRLWIKDGYKIDIYIKEDIEKCNPDIIDEWFNDVVMKLSLGSRHVYILAVQKYFEYLVKYNLIPENKNPTKILPAVKRPTVFNDTTEDSDRVYTQEDIKKMMTIPYPPHTYTDDLRFKAVVSMFLETGLRAFELCSITVGDIRHCKNNTITVLRKGGKRNGVIIGSAAWPYINAYYQTCRRDADDDEAFFLTKRGTPYNANSLWMFVTPRQKYVGVKEGLHNFRHTATSYVAKAGDMAVARDFAGHSNVVMTNRYTHTSIEDRLKAVNDTDMSKLLSSISKQSPSAISEVKHVEAKKEPIKDDLLDELEELFNDSDIDDLDF